MLRDHPMRRQTQPATGRTWLCLAVSCLACGQTNRAGSPVTDAATGNTADADGASGAGTDAGSDGRGGGTLGSGGGGGATEGGGGIGGGPCCALGQGGGTACCGGRCVGLGNDPYNCRGCGVICPTGTYCGGTCPDGTKCDHGPCGDGATCQEGCVKPPCSTSCASGSQCCGSSCCSAGQLCCDTRGPGGGTVMGCTDPTDQGTCPLGCLLCVCASPDTPVATPTGNRPIASLRVGDAVYSVDDYAVKAVPILRINRVASPNHHVSRITLANGATLEISGRHPTADGRSIADLRAGDTLDGVAITDVTSIPYAHAYTYDILPASDSGAYYAGGVLIGSTLTYK